jgi:ribose 5-phosphate isomerase B
VKQSKRSRSKGGNRESSIFETSGNNEPFNMKVGPKDPRFPTYEVADFGAHEMEPGDDYPDFVVPLARAVARGEVTRGLAICGSGVGACVAANKVPGVRAALITDSFSAHQGVEDDDMHVMCLGGRVTGQALSWDLVQMFLNAHFKGGERFSRRLAKVAALEKGKKS